jgi:quercetin dioxygenase-like cupin family protein
MRPRSRACDRQGASCCHDFEAPSETLSPLFEKAFPNVKGKTFTSAIVDVPPAARAVPHRHGEGFVDAYVIDGIVRSKLDGEPMRTCHQGENWVGQPGTHHVLTENTSRGGEWCRGLFRSARRSGRFC